MALQDDLKEAYGSLYSAFENDGKSPCFIVYKNIKAEKQYE